MSISLTNKVSKGQKSLGNKIDSLVSEIDTLVSDLKLWAQNFACPQLIGFFIDAFPYATPPPSLSYTLWKGTPLNGIFFLRALKTQLSYDWSASIYRYIETSTEEIEIRDAFKMDSNA